MGLGLGDREGFVLANASGVLDVACAEHMLALMFALSRRLDAHARDQTGQVWQRQGIYRELYGSTACVVGLGNIGSAVAQRLLALGIRLVGVRRGGSPHPLVLPIYPSAT